MGNVENLVRLFLLEKSYSRGLHLSLQVVRAEDKINQEALDKLNWIQENTTNRLNTNFHVVMTVVSRYLATPLERSIEIKDKIGRFKEYEIQELIIQINRAYEEIFNIVMDIAKRYSIDIVLKAPSEVKLPEIKVEPKLK